MAKINHKLLYIINKARWPWVKISLYLKKKLGWMGVPVIYPYIGYCNGREVYLSGSVVEERGLSKPHAGQGVFSNILTMIKRYVGDEFAGVRLRVFYAGKSKVVETNEEGFFSCKIQVGRMKSDRVGWDKARFELIDMIIEKQPSVSVTGDVLVVGRNPQFIVISDVDDTFLVSHSTQTLRKIRLMLFKNATTRVPFPGVVAFYNALQKGTRDDTFNPIFYVSSSERNLYDLIVEFCQYRGIPKGPILLREMKTSLWKLVKAGGGNHLHKLKKIKSLLQFYPDLPVILIGDSGQKDPEIYLELVKTFPQRIGSVYIRSIGPKRHINRAVDVANECKSLGVDMLLVKHTTEALQHAIDAGYVDPAFLKMIKN